MEARKRDSNRNINLFFIITFLFSWLLWLPFVLDGFNLIQLSDSFSSLMTLSVMIGAFGPIFAAVILTYKRKGWTGIKNFFREAFSFRIKPRFYLLAFILPLLTTAIAHYFVNLTGIDSLPTNLLPEGIDIPVIVLVVPYFIMILIGGGGQEEFGWRGYVQEQLQIKYGILKGSILLGMVWGMWHLPLWFMPGEGHTYYPFLAFLLFIISMSVTIGWIYNASGKKVVIPWIMHSISNVSVPLFPILHMANVDQPGYWVWVVVNVIVATTVSLWYMNKLKTDPSLFSK